MANNQTFYQQLTRLFRSGPAIRRKIKGQDYKNYYDNAVMQSNLGYNGPSGMGVRRENSPFSILGQYGLIERNARYSEFCFDGDTLVYTTKGAVPIKELADKYSNGEIFNVWSYDHNLKQIVISTAHHPRMTREGKPQKLVRIEFDDGGSVTTTLDHKFLLRDGTYIEAANLKASDALMPFYMRRVNGNYHHVYLAKSNKNSNDYGWKSEHILIAESVLGRALNEDEVVHHIDFNPENNDPSNLKVMSIAEHKKFHASLNNRHKFNKRSRKHSAWMKSNNPVKRLDINLDRIFDVANAVDFSLKKTSEILCADYNVIKRRLREVGYANWHEFASNRGNLTTLRNASRVLVEMREPTLENLKKVALTSSTIYEASSKLQCTENSIRRFLKRNGNQTWLEFKESNKAFRSQRKPSVAYQDICSAVSATDSKQSLADKMGVTPNMIMSSLENAGFQSFSNWLDNYKNHKVLNVVFLDEERVVYNLTVDGHHNLAVGSLNGSDSAQERPYSMVICRQSEMEYTSEIATALDIYADEACSGDENGKCFHIFSENPQIQRALEELFYEVYNIDFEGRRDIRNLVKNGDFFRYIEVVPEHGVIMSEPIPVNEIEREEGYDPNDPHAVRFKLLTRGGKYLQNWQVLHFRILANDLMLPYGTSFLESIRRTWRQLVMMEDAMLVYRVVRSPERRVFYIDVSTVASTDVASYMEAVKEQIRGNSIVDKLTGRVDVRNNPVSVDDDYFMPTRPNSNTKIETLAGGQHVSATEDVEYIRSKLISGLKVPKAYLGFDEAISSKATLAQEDVRFSRTIVNLQKLVIAELNKLAILHLFAIGFVGEDLLDFELSFSNPSTVALQQKLALTSSRLDAAAKAWDLAKETGMMDMEYIQRDILGFRAEDIVKMRIGAQQDQIRMAQLKALLERKVKEDTDDEAMVDAFDPSNYEVPGSPIQNMPTNQSNGVNVADKDGNPSGNGKSRPHSSPNQDKITKKSVTDPSKPPVKTNASPNIDRLKTQARRSKEFTGNRALSMPDFAAMLSQDNRYAKDPYDMKSFGKLTEYRRPEFVGDVNSIPYGINRNVYYSLLRFAEAHGKYTSQQQNQSVDLEIISEGTEEDNDEDVLLNLETVFAKE